MLLAIHFIISLILILYCFAIGRSGLAVLAFIFWPFALIGLMWHAAKNAPTAGNIIRRLNPEILVFREGELEEKYIRGHKYHVAKVEAAVPGVGKMILGVLADAAADYAWCMPEDRFARFQHDYKQNRTKVYAIQL